MTARLADACRDEKARAERDEGYDDAEGISCQSGGHVVFRAREERVCWARAARGGLSGVEFVTAHLPRMSGLLWGAREEEQPKSWWASLTDGITLTYYQRIVGFVISFVIGLVFCFMVR